jgi:hypothetical protein
MNFVQPILSLVVHCGWEVHYMDVHSSFLHGDLIEDVYMKKLLIFEKDGSLVCQVEKYLYGLKQVPGPWYEKIDYFFLNFGLKHYESSHNIYVIHVNDDTLIVALYVDYLVITGGSIDLILGLKK